MVLTNEQLKVLPDWARSVYATCTCDDLVRAVRAVADAFLARQRDRGEQKIYVDALQAGADSLRAERDDLQAYLDKVLKYQQEGVLVYERMAAEFNEWRDKAINRKEGLRLALLGVDDLRRQLQEARKG